MQCDTEKLEPCVRTLVPLPSVILQPFMRVQDQRKLMSTKGINVSENEW